MRTSAIRKAIVPGVAALALLASACGAANEDTTPSSSAPAPAESSSAAAPAYDVPSVTLNGGGSSAQTKAQAAWAAGLQAINSGFTLNYDPAGSGAGRSGFIAGTYAYAGSDGALSQDETDQATTFCGASPIEVPVYISPIAVVYNLPGVTDLKLDAATISGIFSGKITKWNDAAIAALNSGATLPSTTITPIHRSDKSGTQKNFTEYLEKGSDGAWPEKAGDAWPDSLASVGAGAEGTSGVAAAVTAGEGTIAFIDESAVSANSLVAALVKVGEDFVAPSADGAAAAAEAASPAGLTDTDLALTVDRATTDSSQYPVMMISYAIACQTYADADTAKAVKALLSYALSAEGQQAAAEAAGSAPLSEALSSSALELVNAIS